MTIMFCTLFVAFCVIIHEVTCCHKDIDCPNITVAVLMERFPGTDAPFNFERNIGIVKIAMNKSREILKDSANLNLITRYVDASGCTELEWGALAAEVYHNNEIHAIIGPGKSLR